MKQGCVLLVVLYNTYADYAFREMIGMNGVDIGELNINRIMYVDDTVIIASTEKQLSALMNQLVSKGKLYDIEVNMSKTKVMVVSRNGDEHANIRIDGQRIESYKYLGVSIDNDGREGNEVKRRIAMAKQTFWQDSNLLRNNLRIATNLRILKACVFSTFRYGCEVWGLRKSDEAKIRSFEMCYRPMLKIPWTDRVTNVEVLRRMGMQNTELLEKINERQLHFLGGHALRGSAGEELKTIINGAATQRNTGRLRKRITWYDSSKEITRDWHEANEMAQDRNKWREAVRLMFANNQP